MKPLPRKEAFKIGSKKESSILRAVEEIAVLDGNIFIKSSPVEVGLLQCLTHNYLCTSVDGLVQMNIDGVLQNVPLVLKKFLPMIVGKLPYK